MDGLGVVLQRVEGLAVGVAFGAAAQPGSSHTIAAAIALAVGIGIQNFPEGMAVSLPLHREGMPRCRAFWFGQLSGMVEPLGALYLQFFWEFSGNGYDRLEAWNRNS